MPALRSSWQNCARDPDQEILAIDEMEDSLAPLDENTIKIRRLISSLELCHHKAERWVELIIEAIGNGYAHKGPVGTRPRGTRHPIEDRWQSVCDALTAWCAGDEAGLGGIQIPEVAADRLATLLGPRTPLRVWQVERVVSKVRSVLDPSQPYFEIVEHGERNRGNRGFRKATLEAALHDTANGREAEITLASAIDHLEPCHWNFMSNLDIVLGAIGGELHPRKPFGACRRNLKLTPIRDRMSNISKTLRAFHLDGDRGPGLDDGMLQRLGASTPTKRWLAASLDKTIRLQLGL